MSKPHCRGTEMNREVLDEGDDIIESSQQAPMLRENVRKRRIFYGETSLTKLSDSKRRRNVSARQRNNATVSQCMQQEWTTPRAQKRTTPGAKETNGAPGTQCDVEEYLKFPTQQEVEQDIDCGAPSVNLFEHQRDVIQRYMFNETSEAQQEEMLDRMLQGFRTSYEQASAQIREASPVAKVINMSAKKEVEMVTIAEPIVGPAVSENIYEPLVEVIELPKEIRVERDDVPPMVIDGCLDLSTKRDKTSRQNPNAYCARNEISQKNQHVWNTHFNERMFANNDNGILDPHMTRSRGDQRGNSGKEYVSKHFQTQQQEYQRSSYKKTTIANRATQTRAKLTRNAGIQFRPVASFDMTKYNVISLARMVGSNPDSMYRNLRDILATSHSRTRTLWHERDLSQVFTEDDPYYANLQYFMNPRH